jgi:hypothetical protein
MHLCVEYVGADTNDRVIEGPTDQIKEHGLRS